MAEVLFTQDEIKQHLFNVVTERLSPDEIKSLTLKINEMIDNVLQSLDSEDLTSNNAQLLYHGISYFEDLYNKVHEEFLKKNRAELKSYEAIYIPGDMDR
ncbi:MAG: hypothetical protein PHW96_02730 [Candidatus Nanoarchaeia archaeon]|nr:hypothetical protein [Candidatus Nanoarchaeia archaeon]